MKKDIKLLPVLLILIYISTVNSDCSKRITCNQTILSFKVNTKVLSDYDSILINDTVWIELNSPVILFDDVTQTSVNYSGSQNLGTVLQCVKFIGGTILDPGAVPAANDFVFFIVNGIVVPNPINPEKNREFLFEEIQGNYRFKVGVVPKQQGIFAIAVSDAANVYRRNDGCTKAGFSITFSNTNQHLYFYEQNRPGYTPSEYERKHMYCFKVK